MKKLWIYCSLFDEYNIGITRDLLNRTYKLRKNNNMITSLICFSNVHSKNNELLYDMLTDEIRIYQNDQFCNNQIDLYVDTLKQLVLEELPDFLLFTGINFHKDIAAQLSVELEVGLTADCVKYDYINDDFIQIRNIFDGEFLAHIKSNSFIKMSTAYPVYSRKNLKRLHNAKVIETEINIKPPDFILPDNFFGYKDYHTNLENDSIILAAGRGLKNKENIEKLHYISRKLNVGFAVTRSVVEMGWAKEDNQVGISARYVNPKFYIAFGISGALQHLQGINEKSKIIAVNTDANAPISLMCDYYINDNAIKIIDLIFNKIE